MMLKRCAITTTIFVFLLLSSCELMQNYNSQNSLKGAFSKPNLSYSIDKNMNITLENILHTTNNNALYYLIRESITETCWIDYPQLYGMENVELQNKANEYIKETIHSRYFSDNDIKGYEGPVEDEVARMDYQISCEVKLCNDNIISIAFFLHKYFEGSYYKEGDAFTINVNLNTGESIDVTSIYNINSDFFDTIIQSENAVERSLSQNDWTEEYLFMVKSLSIEASNHIYFSQGYIGICAPVKYSSLVGEFSVPYKEVAIYRIDIK